MLLSFTGSDRSSLKWLSGILLTVPCQWCDPILLCVQCATDGHVLTHSRVLEKDLFSSAAGLSNSCYFYENIPVGQGFVPLLTICKRYTFIIFSLLLCHILSRWTVVLRVRPLSLGIWIMALQLWVWAKSFLTGEGLNPMFLGDPALGDPTQCSYMFQKHLTWVFAEQGREQPLRVQTCFTLLNAKPFWNHKQMFCSVKNTERHNWELEFPITGCIL